jgi:N-acylneuraminate cytidylyltransferase
MKTIALIPARSGSKGLPNKNIKNIAGKPLIGWSIEQALAAKDIEEVYVSTNCKNIARIAELFGAKVPFLRPEAISGDEATTEDTISHFLSFLQKNKIVCDNLLLIQCTSPVRQSGRFDDAIHFFYSNHYDSILSVSESHRFYWKNLKEPVPLYNFQKRPRRQNIAKDDLSYFETGSFYLFKKEMFLRYKNRICGSVGLYVTPENEMFDIDGITDFSICEALLNVEKRVQTFAA